MKQKTKRDPLYIGISTLVVVTVATLAGLFLGVTHRESKKAAIQMAGRLFSEINEKSTGFAAWAIDWASPRKKWIRSGKRRPQPCR